MTIKSLIACGARNLWGKRSVWVGIQTTDGSHITRLSTYSSWCVRDTREAQRRERSVCVCEFSCDLSVCSLARACVPISNTFCAHFNPSGVSLISVYLAMFYTNLCLYSCSIAHDSECAREPLLYYYTYSSSCSFVLFLLLATPVLSRAYDTAPILRVSIFPFFLTFRLDLYRFWAFSRVSGGQ